MTAAKIAAASFACDLCAFAPRLTPGFCDACRASDARLGRKRANTENSSRPTPRTTIEAVMWCVRERGTKALYERANIERLSRCDDAAAAEIDARIKKLAASDARAP
jgi:hypothetical protein